MENDLNKKYFETRQKHKDSHNKRGYLIWTIIGLGTLAFFIGRSIIKTRETKQSIEQRTKDFVEQGTISKSDTLITAKSTGTKILVLNNCLYKELDTNFASVKNDGSGFTCVVKRIIPDPEYTSSITQWENLIKQTEPSYVFSDLTKDSTGTSVIETANVKVLSNDGQQMKGLVRIIKSRGLYYVTQVVTYEDHWDILLVDIGRIFASIEIVD